MRELPLRLNPLVVPADPVTRFAPAPTGYLHLGHVLNAVFVWGVARRFGGTVLLRVEDHDRGRCRAEYEEALLEDLEWLGLEPDRPTVGSFREGLSPFRQSDRETRYQAALADLLERHEGYRCGCSRRRIDELVGAVAAPGAPAPAPAPGSETRYPGTCRSRPPAAADPAGVRIVMERGAERFTDLRYGSVEQEPERQCGDLLVKDRSGRWTYQFAVTVDDWDQGVNLVIRGDDLLASTGRQVRLARLLGRGAQPVFLHHPLVLKPSGEKLSKASGDTAVAQLRRAGVAAGEVLAEAARRGGLVAGAGPLRPADLPDLIDHTLKADR